MKFLKRSAKMELHYSGQSKKNIAGRSEKISEEIRNAIENVQKADTPRKISELKKLRQYKTHYRIKVNEYRIGVIIRNDKVWFSRFDHRNLFYKKLFP